ncbi:molybdopterin-binding protein [Clostridium sp. MT-14]|uniref:molybdopterin-binding protein n=1 Tax=Clostridium sp. MT-14 TaxID=3348360 RepID=UPI0035F4052D
MEWDLLEKTTFWIDDVNLKNANLDEIAEKVSHVLDMTTKEIMVVDVRPGLLAFDIMKRKVQAESVIGKEKEVLSKLSEISGVELGNDAAVHSEGILGLIGLDSKEAKDVLEKSAGLTRQIKRAVSKRAKVFASGAEVIAGKIEDTNSPYIIKSLEKYGYKAKFGGVLRDDVLDAENGIEEALEEGYGLIVTTGGVGAEDKDFNVEAILKIDKDACTPWILKFKPDYHRHHKEGVRIGVGKVGMSYIVALPGPHEEAKLGCDILIRGIQSGLDKDLLAETIASALRQRWRNKMK